jgi:hypothetical protein
MFGRLALLFLGIHVCSNLVAQGAQASVEEAIKEAERLYREDLHATWKLVDSLARSGDGDRDQRERILLLKAVTEARSDSIPAMRRTVEALFRNHRAYVLKPYDPLIVELPEREDIYNTYQRLMGGREVGPGALQKDQGRWRAGLLAGAVLSRLEQSTDRQVFDSDGTYSYTTPAGWEALAISEYDVAHNLAVRLAAGYGEVLYRTRNASVRYEERMALVPLSLGLRKLFWLGERSPWVPHLTGGVGMTWIASANANVERAGDGVRLLGPMEVDRLPDRERQQFHLYGGAGISRKVGHTVLFLEGRYEHALSGLSRNASPYRDDDLLVRYYHVDNDLSLSRIVLCAGLQYVIAYHQRNRIHP